MGLDKLSSETRLINTLNVLHKNVDYHKLFPEFYNHRQDKGPKYDLVRAQNKLWTSSQIIMNLNKRELILYLIPGAVDYNGIENRLPKGRTPSIKFTVRRFDETPDEKHDYYFMCAGSNGDGYHEYFHFFSLLSLFFIIIYLLFTMFSL